MLQLLLVLISLDLCHFATFLLGFESFTDRLKLGYRAWAGRRCCVRYATRRSSLAIRISHFDCFDFSWTNLSHSRCNSSGAVTLARVEVAQALATPLTHIYVCGCDATLRLRACATARNICLPPEFTFFVRYPLQLC